MHALAKIRMHADSKYKNISCDKKISVPFLVFLVPAMIYTT
jgi:hypothetical protein